VRVRQALSYAAPKQQIIDQVEGGNARIANGPILDNNYAYNSNIEKYNFDQARAASLLDAAGWKKEIITADNLAAINNKQATTSSNSLTDDEKAEIALGPGTWLYQAPVAAKAATKTTKATAAAAKKYLIINLSIVDDEEDAKIAETIKESWEKIGVKT